MRLAIAGLLLVVSALLAACASDDAGLTRAEVEEIVRAEMAEAGSSDDVSDQAQSEGSISNDDTAATPAQQGLTRAEVEEIVRAEMAEAGSSDDVSDQAQSEGSISNDDTAATPAQQGLTRAEVEAIVGAAIAGVPSRSTPAEYTQYFVESAIARYQTQGLDATLAHYNRAESVDGQWYVFIIDENDLVIAHPDPERLGLDVKGWVGTDANGYEFGPAMLAADESGAWVSYVYNNPESGGLSSGDFELKNVWVKRKDGLLFASGWYIDADAFTEQLVSVAVDKYRELGLAGTMTYFASPGSILAGLDAAIDYYNSADTIDGHWFAFIGDPDGNIVGHSDISKIGENTQGLFGGEPVHVHEEGEWVESESLRVFVAEHDGHLFGSGWSRDK